MRASSSSLSPASGGSLPKYIRREFESYLACGIPAHGFLQVICTGCGDTSILPFSCKKRGFCPSCGARKMAEEAAFLTDWVLPKAVGYRQYVLTFPMPLRFWIARNGSLLSQMYRIFSAEVRRFVEGRSGADSKSAARKAVGTISFIQRFGDGLRYNPHIHLLVSGGAWVESESNPGDLEFHPALPPAPEEVCALLERIQSRIVKHLSRLGLIKDGPSRAEASGALELELGEKDSSPEEELLGEMQGCSTQNRFALSTPPGKPVRRERQTELGELGSIGERARLSSDESRLAILKGFSLHAGTSAQAKGAGEERDPDGNGGLERLLRYMARNSTPLERLKPASGGDILIKLKTRWSDGTTHLRFSGVELCERLAALVPHPRLNLIRFGGVFAPRHKLRARVVAQAPRGGSSIDEKAAAPSPAASSEESRLIPPKLKKYSLSWNELRARVFEEDLSHCRQCRERVKITDAILDRDAIERILTSQGIPTGIPTFAPPSRAPPGQDVEQSEFSWG